MDCPGKAYGEGYWPAVDPYPDGEMVFDVAAIGCNLSNDCSQLNEPHR